MYNIHFMNKKNFGNLNEQKLIKKMHKNKFLKERQRAILDLNQQKLISEIFGAENNQKLLLKNKLSPKQT